MQDQPEEEEIPEWLDPIYDEEDPKEFMQAELDATPEREAAAKAAMERLFLDVDKASRPVSIRLRQPLRCARID